MDLLFYQSGFSGIHDMATKMNKSIEDFHTQAENLKNKIDEDEDSWQGRSRLEFLAFIDLILQFHNTLQVDAFADHVTFLEDAVDKIETFLDEFQEYKDLGGI